MAADTDDMVPVQINAAGDTAAVITDYVTVDGYGAAGHKQIVGLSSGVNGETAPVGADTDTTAKRGLFVESHLRQARIETASGGLTIATTAYTAGDQVGTEFTMAGAARYSGGTGRLVGVQLIDVNDVIGAYDVVITRAAMTGLAGNNSPWANTTDAQAVKLIDVLSLGGAVDLGGFRFARAMGLNIPYDCSGGTSLYATLITREDHAIFTAVTDLTLVFFCELD